MAARRLERDPERVRSIWQSATSLRKFCVGLRFSFNPDSARRWGAALQLAWLLVRYLPTIVRLAETRHEAGFREYGDRAYDWPAATRLRNVLEELADAHVYLTTGPIQEDRP